MGCLDRLADSGHLVDPEVVHDDDIARLQCWHQDLLDIGHEELSVDRTVDDERGGQAVAAQRADEGCRLPMPMRHGRDQALTAFGPLPQHSSLSYSTTASRSHRGSFCNRPLTENS